MLTTLTAADGTRISAETYGEGRYTFVLAHGFTGSRKRPALRLNADWFAQAGRVVLFDQRGHADSGGRCSFGLNEPLDLDAAVAWARELSPNPVVTVGFSMGAASAVRHAALSQNVGVGTAVDQRLDVRHAPDATIIVGGVAQWYFQGTEVMRQLHRFTSTAWGRQLIRWRRKVRLDLHAWAPENAPREHLPIDPTEAAGLVRGPLLVIQGTEDNYFPTDHGERLHRSATEGGNARTELWIEQGMGHAERATSEALIQRTIAWVDAQLGS